MAATTYLAPALKQLAGVPGGGRRLAKPVYHYSLNWPPDETVIVEHRDRKHSHVHVDTLTMARPRNA